MTLEEETTTLCRYIGNHIPSNTVSHPRTDTSLQREFVKMTDWVGSGISSVEPSGSATTVLFVGLVEQSTVAQTCFCDLANL